MRQSSATLTTDRLHYKLQQSSCRAKERKKKNLAIGPKGVPDTKMDKLNLTSSEIRPSGLHSFGVHNTVFFFFHRTPLPALRPTPNLEEQKMQT
jgi:hypothetical protein